MNFFFELKESYAEENREMIEKIVNKMRAAKISELRFKTISSIGGLLAHEPDEPLFLIDINKNSERVGITDDVLTIKDSLAYKEPLHLSSFLNMARKSERLKNINIISVPESYDAVRAFDEILLLLKNREELKEKETKDAEKLV